MSKYKRNSITRVLYAILIFTFLPLILGGCSDDINRKEIEELDIIRIVGIDYSNQAFTISALYNENGGVDSASMCAVVVKAEGKSLYEAYENLKRKNKKSITLAHTNYFLIGDGAARNGLGRCMDFISREETIKMDSYINIVKDQPALRLLDDAKEKNLTIHEDLEAISQKQIETITQSENTIANYLNEIKEDTCLLIPYFVLEDNDLFTKGYAAFEDGRLFDYLDQETSLGINFIKNRIRTCPIYLEDTVGLAIADTNTNLKSRLRNGKIIVKIQLDFETNVKEVNTEANIFAPEVLRQLTQQQNEYLQAVMQKALNYCSTTKKDVIGVTQLIKAQHPSQWQTLQKNWDEYLQTIQYDFDIHSRIAKSLVLGNIE